MLFQIIDNKQECSSIYCNNSIISSPDYNSLSMTWDYNTVLKEYNIEYASLYAQGKNIDEICPDHLRDEWETVKKKHFSFIKSFDTAKVKSKDYCFYDLVPESFVVDFFNVKSKITEWVLNNYNKPSNYDHLVELSNLLSQIKNNKLNVDLKSMDSFLHNFKARNIRKKLSRIHPYINYNIFGTITGRLTTKKDSFPILTLNKDYRSILKPKNDWFIELDFNAAELRCVLALNKEKQPSIDIHEWNGKIINNLSDHKMDRDSVKQKIFSWMYGQENVSLGIPQIEKYYDKKKIVKNYWNGKYIQNPFGRKIECDKFHALNFIIQSTTSDTFLRRAVAVNKLLEKRKSFTTALIHDSMLIDFSRDDKDLLKELITEFGNTDLGIFKVNCSVGSNFGNMRKLYD